MMGPIIDLTTMSPHADDLGSAEIHSGSRVLSDITNAQPLEDGDRATVPSVSETMAKPDKNMEDVENHKVTNSNPIDLPIADLGDFKIGGKDQTKKKSRKGRKGRGPTALSKKRGTGFEPYYCDPPMTPEEVEEEKTSIYSPDRPFVDRIEECIQRYRARRRLDNVRSLLLDKYLALGGIDSSPRMFQGMKTIDVDDATNNEIREMTAGDVIYRGSTSSRYYNPNEPEHWDVDFAGVVAGFFSERIFKLAGTDTRITEVAVGVVENFLNYVLHHDVCPEHADDISKAKEICSMAGNQISRCFRVIWDGPGDFNIACELLFDNGKRVVFDPNSFPNSIDMSKEHAVRVFYASVAAHDLLYSKVKSKNIKTIEVIDEVKQTFEVEQVAEPDESQIQLYLGVKDVTGVPGKIKPCGLLTLKPIEIEDGYDKGCVTSPSRGIDQQETFVVDLPVLKHLTVGMKLKLAICSLNIGVKFIKRFNDVRPRYYTFLPQELMMRYREPHPNDRPAPSVEDPAMDEEGGGDDE